MRRLVLTIAILAGFVLGGIAQSLHYDFEDGTLQGWTTLDGDGDGHNWQPNTDGIGHNGSDGMVLSYSKDPVTGDSLAPNNFIVSPRVRLPQGGSEFCLWALPLDESRPAEHWAICVSTTVNDDPLAFTTLQEWTLTFNPFHPGEWTQYCVDLSLYAGQDVYIAIRHFFWEGFEVSQSAICIDDIDIPGEIVETQDNSHYADAIQICADGVSHFPLPVGLENAETGPDYNCLLIQSNPSWFFVKMAEPGDVIININVESNDFYDVDFCCWGPFNTLPESSVALTQDKVVDCSYNPEPATCTIPSEAQTGEYYVMVVTNYANLPGDLTFTIGGGTGSLECLSTERFDFSAVCETGQTLYYIITDEEQKTVKLTFPHEPENPWESNYWEGYEKPQGSMTLPSTVTYEGETYTVTSIDASAFYECEGLTGTLVVPGSITDINTYAFYACTGLNVVELQEGVTTIWHNAFTSCSGITSISFPNTLTSIFHNAFSSCSSLTSLHLPASVTTVYPSVFTNDSALESITVDESHPLFYSENNAIIKRDDKTLFLGCKNTVIPDDIVAIGENAFNGAGNGGDLVIPNSVRSIGDYAFQSCHFSGTITLSDSLSTIGIFAFANSEFSGSLIMPNTVTSVGLRAFDHCLNLTGELKLSESLTEIQHTTFYGSGFTGVLVIPNSVTSLSNSAFYDCHFSDLVLSENLTFIGGAAFSGCENFTGILRIPASVTRIENHAFRNTRFTEIYSYNPIPPELEEQAFNGYASVYFYDPEIPIHVPIGCKEAYETAPNWEYFQNFIEDIIRQEWYYEIQNENGSITYQYMYQAGDTIINNDTAHILVKINTLYDKGLHDEVTHEYVYVRDGKVYWWNKTLGEFTVLYDYEAEEGDEWEIKVGTESLVMHVDVVQMVTYKSQTYRMLTVSDPNDLFSGNIVCGIGHLTSFFPERLMDNGDGIRVEGMRCYWSDSKLVFKYGDEDCDAIYDELHGIEEDGPSTPSTRSGTAGTFAVYPNPTNGILFVETVCTPSLPDQTYRITNLVGQTVLSGNIIADNQQINVSSLPQGMYFVTVGDMTRKFVVR